MIIRLLDGPLEGTIHEVAGDWPVPDRFGLIGDGKRHWYTTNDDRETARYDDKSEPFKATTEDREGRHGHKG